MTYDLIEPRPEPTTLALDDAGAYHDAVKSYEKTRERIVDAVREYTEVVESTKHRYHIRAVVPYHVTAYRYTLDDDAVATLRDDYGRTVRQSPTDGFEDVGDTDVYRSVPCHHREAFTDAYPQDDLARSNVHHALETSIVSTLEDGEVSVPITRTVQDVVDKEPDAPRVVEPDADPKAHEMDFETVDRELRIGTATYKVDAIVDPDDWDGGQARNDD
jgi:hypothetical protein